jgi:L-ascorbate metabolism protein UlaG (beta-lactamase superfamily)
MKRRQFVYHLGAGLIASIAAGTIDRSQSAQAQTSGSVSIQYLGHSCFKFTGDGRRILVNPFRPIGCTAGYRAPQVATDLVMISSRLFDEGVTDGIPGNPRVLSESGIYQFRGMQVQGIETLHDRIEGRRFGTNIAWRWNQSGLNFLHLGGIASAITVEQQILMGRPDVLLIPVGGGDKSYTPQEALQSVRLLNPKIVIPTQYRTQAADAASCNIEPLDSFLTLMQETSSQQTLVQRVSGDAIAIRPQDLPEAGPVVKVLSYRFS